MNHSKKIKILHVIGALEGGGAQRQLQILIKNTDTDKYRIGILCLHNKNYKYFSNLDIDLIEIPRGMKWNIFSLWFRIHKAVMAYQPDILHVYQPEIVTIPAAFTGRLSGVPIISSVLRSMRSVNSFKQRIRDHARCLQHLFADRIVANFNPEGEPFFLRKLFFRKKGLVIHNGIVVDMKKTTTVPVFLTNPMTSFLILYAARIVPQKRLDILLDSFIMLRKDGLDISLAICGEGHPDLTCLLKQKIQQASMQEYVSFLGYRQDWQFLAQNADLFILPSTSEGMPYVLFEAMLLGLPCIATDISVIRSVVSHKENIWLVQAGSQSSLTEGIREMYHSAPLRKKLAQAGQEHAKSFTVEKMVSKYENIYDELLET